MDKIEKLKKELKKEIIFYVDNNELDDDRLRDKISEKLNDKLRSSGIIVSINDKHDIINSIFYSLRGLDILDDLLEDDEITEIMINNYDKIFVEKNGCVKKVKKCFSNPEKYEDIIQRIVASSGREVNLSNPIVDSRLEDGSRVNVVLPPISLDGPVMTIRKFSKETMTVEMLIELEAINKELAEFIKKLVISKYNIIICGGTGTGKTTFLNAISNFIPSEERIVCIEDSAELQIKGISNLIRMETRNSNSSGYGKITMRDLIRTSLRMRPDRIIIGEVRGKETFDLVQALNTGHEGEICTGHSNSCFDMISRLETMAMMAEEGIPLSSIRSQIISSIDILIYLGRMKDKSRKVLEVSEIDKESKNEARIHKLYEYSHEKNILLKKGNLINKTKYNKYF